ncbi:MAG: prepilin-type N-terminal cleavage/methylation domain-containing protein [Gammaproteobacteria bacterium]|nr:prepilin-type N-terminal cleavage/methylation domain-containing protein [Gammaproteobacteria bacterium]
MKVSTMNIQQQTSRQQRAYQQGFTLVEIMVAITLSVILLAGVMQIFIGSKTTYNLQSGLGRLHENARFALDIMAQNIGMAGYTSNLIPITAFNNANTLENATENTNLGFTVISRQASDTIEVNYESPTDCLGNATGGTATDRYYIDATNLMCLGNGNANPAVLAEGIENLQILYGQDTDGDNIANHYVSANNIVAANPVINVRIAILASTVQSVGGADTGVYVLLNTPPIGPFGDTLMRQVYTRTIKLRNPASF